MPEEKNGKVGFEKKGFEVGKEQKGDG